MKDISVFIAEAAKRKPSKLARQILTLCGLENYKDYLPDAKPELCEKMIDIIVDWTKTVEGRNVKCYVSKEDFEYLDTSNEANKAYIDMFDNGGPKKKKSSGGWWDDEPSADNVEFSDPRLYDYIISDFMTNNLKRFKYDEIFSADEGPENEFKISVHSNKSIQFDCGSYGPTLYFVIKK